MDKYDFMEEALKQAQKAFDHDEVPVGAVIVKDGKIISRGYNQKEEKKNALKHAEIVAIEKALKKLNSKYLDDCELYVTLEPCVMCAGACVQSRLKKVIYGASDPKGGAVKSVVEIFKLRNINHRPLVEGKIKEEESSKILKDYFKMKRKNKV